MDELGRGTATHDGVAIACATLSHLVSHIQCLSLFVTHYPEVASLAVNQQHSTADEQPDAPTPQSPAAAAISEGCVAEQSAGPGPAAQGSKQGAAGGGSAQTAGNSSDGAGQIQASAGSSISKHVAVYHMSYVRQDTAPQQAAAEAAATGTGAESSPAAAAGGTAAADSSSASAAAEAIPVITFLYKLAEGAADESFGLNVAQVCMWAGGRGLGLGLAWSWAGCFWRCTLGGDRMPQLSKPVQLLL